MRVSTTFLFFFSSRRRHTSLQGDWSSDVCSSDLKMTFPLPYSAKFLIASVHMLNKMTFVSRLACFICSAASVIPMATSWRKIGRASCRDRMQVVGVGWVWGSTRYDAGRERTHERH